MPDSTEPLDPRDNPESQQAESEASQTGSRSSQGGPVMSGGRPAGSVPGDDPESGDLLDGVTIDPQDAEQAVPGDTGPEHPGRRS